MPGVATPPLIVTGFASGAGAAYIQNPIPVPSQVPAAPGRASYTDGFPPLNSALQRAGGVAPFQADFNGILFAATQNIAAMTGGQYSTWNAAWATANGGYQVGAILRMLNQRGWWVNLVDGNTVNPDAVAAANNSWAPVGVYGIGNESGLSNLDIMLGPEAACDIIIASGTLTANVSLIFPTWQKQWLIINNTAGAYALTARTAGGTGVVIPPGGPTGPALVYGDGVNIQPIFSALDDITLIRSTSASIVSNVSPSADSQLISPVLPSGWYSVTARLFFQGAAGTNPGIRAFVAANVSTSGYGFYFGSINGYAVAPTPQQAVPFGNAFSAISTGGPDCLEIAGSIFLASPGQIYVNWSQYTSSAAATTLHIGSSLSVQAVQG